MVQYHKDVEAWKSKYHITAADLKRKTDKKVETSDEEKKGTKTKGTKETKEQKKKSAEKKKEEPKKDKKSV